MLPFFLLAVLNVQGQNFGLEYLQNYWLPANARSIGMGKGNSALHGEAISTSLVGANFRDFNAFTVSYGKGFNAFPAIESAEVEHFSIGASLDNKVMLSINSNSFKTSTIQYLGPANDTISDAIHQSKTSLNLGFKTKSDFLYAFNLDFLRVGDDYVRAIGFSVGADSEIINNKQHSLKVGFSAGLNGINSFIQEIFTIPGKIAPQKFALGGSLDYNNNKYSKWIGNVKYGIEYHNYVNYGSLKLFRTGLEVEILEYIFLRGGYYLDDPQGNDSFRGFTTGLGIILPFHRWFKLQKDLEIRIDGAVLPYPDFSDFTEDFYAQDLSVLSGNSQIISVTFRAEL